MIALNVVFIIGSLSGGGAERVTSIVANALAANNHNVSIILIGNNKVEYSVSNYINIFDCSENYKYRGVGFLNRIIRIRSVLNSVKPDIIVSFTVAVNIYAIVSNLFSVTPLIVSERNDPYFDPSNKLLRIARILLYPFAERFVFQNNAEKEFFCSNIKNRSVVIPNPLNPLLPEVTNGISDNRFVMVSRLEPQKNISNAINAFEKVIDRHPDYVLEIYGQGSLENNLRELICSKGLTESVILKGFSKDIYNDIMNAYGFIITSTYEGMCNSLLEAMALGIVPISSDYSNGAVREIINDGYNGFVVPVNNSEELANRINDLISNPNMRDAMSYRASLIRESYSVKRVSEAWISLLKECLM